MYDVTMTPPGQPTYPSYQAVRPSIDDVLRQNQIMKGHKHVCWVAVGNALNGNGAFGLPSLSSQEYDKVLAFCGPNEGSFYSDGAMWSVHTRDVNQQSYQAMKDIQQMFPKYC